MLCDVRVGEVQTCSEPLNFQMARTKQSMLSKTAQKKLLEAQQKHTATVFVWVGCLRVCACV